MLSIFIKKTKLKYLHMFFFIFNKNSMAGIIRVFKNININQIKINKENFC